MAWLAYQEYLRPPVREDTPETATAEAADQDLREAVVFQTSKQRTILRITSLGIECHLEDKRAGRGGHQWTIGPGEAARILKTRDYSVNPTYRASSGLFAIGRRKNWLYLKKLFPEPEYLHGTLTDLLEQAAKDADN